jgi:cytochrome c556
MNLKTYVIASAMLFGAMSANVQADMAEDAIQYRQSVFQTYKWHFGAMGAMVRGKVPYDAAQFKHHAEALAAVAPLAAEGFIEGSDMGDTAAKDELWENLSDLNERFDELTSAATKLAAASGGELDAVKGAFGAVGKGCKGCHDNYREK